MFHICVRSLKWLQFFLLAFCVAAVRCKSKELEEEEEDQEREEEEDKEDEEDEKEEQGRIHGTRCA